MEMRRRYGKLIVITTVAIGLANPCAATDDKPPSHIGGHGSVTLSISPLPQQWRSAFYVNRGFNAAVIHPYASACGFSFAMRNEGSAAIETRLMDWRAIGADGAEVRVKLPESWEAEWAQAGVSQTARIAFHWAQFQSENVFQSGDWIMGMATLAAPPKSPFRLIASYSDSGGDHEIVIEQINCVHN